MFARDDGLQTELSLCIEARIKSTVRAFCMHEAGIRKTTVDKLRPIPLITCRVVATAYVLLNPPLID
jgi:hypothetical protein